MGTGEAGQSCDSFIGVGVYRIDNASTTANLTGPINPLVTTGIAGTRAFNAVAISEILVDPTNPAKIFVSTTSAQAGMGCSYPPFNTVPQQSLRGSVSLDQCDSGVDAIAFSKITVTSAGSVAPDTSGNRDISDLAMEPGNPNVMLAWVMGSTAANDGGVWRTANALAATPTFSRTQATSLGFARGELAINKVGSTVNVVAATEEGSAGRVRKSTDGGVTWPTLLSSLGAPGAGFCSGQCWYDIAVAMSTDRCQRHSSWAVRPMVQAAACMPGAPMARRLRAATPACTPICTRWRLRRRTRRLCMWAMTAASGDQATAARPGSARTTAVSARRSSRAWPCTRRIAIS